VSSESSHVSGSSTTQLIRLCLSLVWVVLAMSSEYDFIVIGGQLPLKACSSVLTHPQEVHLVALLPQDLHSLSKDPKCFSLRRDLIIQIPCIVFQQTVSKRFKKQP